MSNFDHLVPPHIRALGAYTPGKSLWQAEQESGVPCIKLASNENPFGPSPLALHAMRNALAEGNFYPDDNTAALCNALAGKYGLLSDQVLVTPGSTGLLNLAARTLLTPGLNAVTSKLSFIQYQVVATATGATLVETPLRDQGFDLDAIVGAINADTRIVFLANPNNPTGTLLDASALDRFLDRVPTHVVVVIDEAYYEFAQYFAELRGIEYSHSLDYVRQGRNVIVLRTFSKAHGLAGLRIGYGMGPAELIGFCARLHVTFSVSSVAQAAALAALQDEAHIGKTMRNNAEGTQWIQQQLTEMGFQPVPTWANFVYCEVGEDSIAVTKRMQDEGVIIRPLKAWGAPTAIRVSAGAPEENRQFIEAFRKVISKGAARVELRS
jgi:histidinol-phosphate aminotransferase